MHTHITLGILQPHGNIRQREDLRIETGMSSATLLDLGRIKL